MNIIILNQHTKNYGDDIAGISLIEELFKRFNDCSIDIFYNTTGTLHITDKRVNHAVDLSLKNIGLLQMSVFLICSFFGLKVIYKKTMKELRKKVEAADLIFISPCGANIGIYRDWRFLLRSLIVTQLGGKLIFHNNTIGKSGSLVFDILSKYLLKRSRVFVREKASQVFLDSIKIASIRTVDTAFLFNSSEVKKTEDYSVFIPTTLDTWHPSFKGKNIYEVMKDKLILDYIVFLKKNNLKLAILPHMHGEYLESELHKSFVNEFIKLGLPEEQIEILKVENIYEYNRYICNASLVVSMRYHGVVMAIKNAVPFVSLAYENKMLEVCKYAGVEELNYDLGNIKSDDFKINFSAIWNQKANIISTLENSNLYLTKLASIALDQTEFNVYNKLK